MDIEDLQPGTLVLVELEHEFEGYTFFKYERATFHGLGTDGPRVLAFFEEEGFGEWESYFTDGKWFRIYDGSVESVRLVEVIP